MNARPLVCWPFSGVVAMKKRVDADEMLELWNRLGPAGGAATPHIPAEPVTETLAALATAGTAATLDAWASDWSKPLWYRLEAARHANAPH
jgi:hypothetical protein